MSNFGLPEAPPSSDPKLSEKKTPGLSNPSILKEQNQIEIWKIKNFRFFREVQTFVFRRKLKLSLSTLGSNLCALNGSNGFFLDFQGEKVLRTVAVWILLPKEWFWATELPNFSSEIASSSPLLALFELNLRSESAQNKDQTLAGMHFRVSN